MNIKVWLVAAVLGVGVLFVPDDSGSVGKQNRTLSDVYDPNRPRPKLSYGGEVLHPKIPRIISQHKVDPTRQSPTVLG